MTSEITLVLLIIAVTIVLFVTELFPVDVNAIRDAHLRIIDLQLQGYAYIRF